MVFRVIELAEIVQTVFEGEERGSKLKAKAWDTSSQGGSRSAKSLQRSLFIILLTTEKYANNGSLAEK